MQLCGTHLLSVWDGRGESNGSALSSLHSSVCIEGYVKIQRSDCLLYSDFNRSMSLDLRTYHVLVRNSQNLLPKRKFPCNKSPKICIILIRMNLHTNKITPKIIKNPMRTKTIFDVICINLLSNWHE